MLVLKKMNIFRNKNLIIENINIEMPKKGLFCFIGSSGNGKTTFLETLSGINNEFEGKIIFNTKENNLNFFNQNSISFQDFKVLENFSQINNLLLTKISELNFLNAIFFIFKKKEIESAKKMLKKFKLKDYKKKAKKLSGGEKQRLSIARSFFENKKIILLDEPTANLDFKNAKNVMDIIKKESKKKLIICAMHDLKLVEEYADKIFILNNKKIKEIKNRKIKIEDFK